MNIVLFLWGIVTVPLTVILFYVLALVLRPFYICFYTPLFAALADKTMSGKLSQVCKRSFRVWTIYLLITAFYSLTGGALGNLLLPSEEIASSFSFGIFLGALIAACARIIALSTTGAMARGLIYQTLIFVSVVLLFTPIAVARVPYKTVWNFSFITLFQDEVIEKHIPDIALMIISCATLVFAFTEFLLEGAKRLFLVLRMSPVSLFHEMAEGSHECEISIGRDAVIRTGKRVIEDAIRADGEIESIDWFTQSADDGILDKITEMGRFLKLQESGLNRPDARNFARETARLEAGKREGVTNVIQQARNEIQRLKKEAINKYPALKDEADVDNLLGNAEANAQSLVSERTRIITTQKRKDDILKDFSGWFAANRIGISEEFGNRRFLIINERVALPSTPIPPMARYRAECFSNISTVIDTPYWVHCIAADFRHMWRTYEP